MSLMSTINWLSRQQLAELLESTGTAAYDDEPISDLRECLYELIESGDVPASYVHQLAPEQQFKRPLY